MRDINNIKYRVYSIPLIELYTAVLEGKSIEAHMSSTEQVASWSAVLNDPEERKGVRDLDERLERVEFGLDNSFFIVHLKGTELKLLDGFTRLSQMVGKYPNLEVWVKEYQNLSTSDWFKVMLSANTWKFSTYGITEWLDRGFSLALFEEFGLELSKPVVEKVKYTTAIRVIDVMYMYIQSGQSTRRQSMGTGSYPMFSPPTLKIREDKTDIGLYREGFFCNSMFLDDLQQCITLFQQSYSLSSKKNLAVIVPGMSVHRQGGKKEVRIEPFYMLLEYLIHSLCILRVVEQRQGCTMHPIDVLEVKKIIETEMVDWVYNLTTISVAGVQRNRIEEKYKELWQLVKRACSSELQDVRLFVSMC